MNAPRLRVIVPCYNEATRLPAEVFRAYAAGAGDFSCQFLFVNDGSTDGTALVLDGLARHDPQRFAVLHLERNSGKAEAVRQGFLASLATEASLLAFWDADLATPLDMLQRMVELLDTRSEVEMVFGSRVKLLGWDIRRKPMRHYVGRVFATMASNLLRLPIYDTQCGAKMFRVTPTLRAMWQEPFCSRWIFDVELLARFLQQRRGKAATPAEQAIYEMPLPKWEDVGASKVRSRDMFRALADFGRIYWRYRLRGVTSGRPFLVRV